MGTCLQDSKARYLCVFQDLQIGSGQRNYRLFSNYSTQIRQSGVLQSFMLIKRKFFPYDITVHSLIIISIYVKGIEKKGHRLR